MQVTPLAIHNLSDAAKAQLCQRMERDGGSIAEELRKQHPAIDGVKCAAKRQVEGFDRKLAVMLLPVHLWPSAVAAFNNCQLSGQFTSPEQLKQAAAQWVCLFQEALVWRQRNLGYQFRREPRRQWIHCYGHPNLCPLPASINSCRGHRPRRD